MNIPVTDEVERALEAALCANAEFCLAAGLEAVARARIAGQKVDGRNPAYRHHVSKAQQKAAALNRLMAAKADLATAVLRAVESEAEAWTA